VRAASESKVTPDPPRSLRERIEEVALDLFAHQGYGGTSLRHIAEQLGVSKAAVYYHFHAKDDIARVLAHQALDALEAMTDHLVVAGPDLEAWRRALPQIVDVAVEERDLLFMYERNADAFHLLFSEDATLGGRLLEQEERLGTVFADRSIDPETRVRLGCVFGAIHGPLLHLANHYQDMSVEELRRTLLLALTRLLAS
jgi:AcrR family transcriptional regulator